MRLHETQIKGFEAIPEATALLADGEVVAFPTETVYGLGANACDSDAVARIFAAKDRPADNPLIVHVASLEQLIPLVTHIFPLAERLMREFWPGPLTLLLPRSELIPDVVTAGLPTVGVRMPRHPLALALLREAGPLAAPSANRSGKPSPTTARRVFEDMRGRIPLILDGGDCDVGLESTFLALYPQPVILRPGGVTAEQLEPFTGPLAQAVLDKSKPPPSPGMKYKHYSPKAEVWLIRDEDMVKRIKQLQQEWRDGGLVVICHAEHRDCYEGQVLVGGREEHPEEWAAVLFDRLRQCDDMGARRVLVEGCTAQGLGRAVLDRLTRAASCVIGGKS